MDDGVHRRRGTLAQLKMTDAAPAEALGSTRVPLAGMVLPVVSAKRFRSTTVACSTPCGWPPPMWDRFWLPQGSAGAARRRRPGPAAPWSTA